MEHFNLFSAQLTNTFHKLNLQKLEYYAVGDFNIDLLQLEQKHHVRMYADSLIGCLVKCTINKPPRITDCSETLLDHVYTNNPNNKYLSGITLSADLSDHLGTFITVPTKKLDIIHKEPMLIRDMSKFDTKFFLGDLGAALDMLYFNEKDCVNENFEKFVSVFTETINNHAPMRRASRKEKKIKSKPWLSSSL